MNRTAFFAALRGGAMFPKGFKPGQVDGLDAVLDEAEARGTPIFHLSAILSEIYHETGGQMQPVKETVYTHSRDRNPSDATVIKRLDTAYAKGQLPWVKKPYWRDGWFGRGLIQITHEPNYKKLGLTKETALETKASVKATFDGMEKGLFTGKKLSDYDYLVTRNPDVPGYKYYASRAIVNGDTAKNGAMIATYAKTFEQALRAAGYGSPKPVPVEPPPLTPRSCTAVVQPLAVSASGLSPLVVPLGLIGTGAADTAAARVDLGVGTLDQPQKRKTTMDKISKALAAAVGGAATGTIGLPFMPADTPWYGYLALYVITIGLPAVLTYLAPKNAV
jgi:hypothetical protein